MRLPIFRRLLGTAATPPPATAPLDLHVGTRPSPQHAVDLFRGEWVSRFPEDSGVVSGGGVPLFEDPRLAWGVSALDGVRGMRVLELGPLEGGHSTLLERAGADAVTAVESNGRAYLRCLVTKEVMRLQRCQFLLGDLVEYLRHTPERFDLCVASGVLYHMVDPLELVSLIARVADRAYVWTHYYDAALVAGKLAASHFTAPVAASFGGYDYVAHRYAYRQALSHANFSGGRTAEVSWIERASLLGAFAHFGLTGITTGPEEPEHPTGPAITFVATRRGA